MAYFLKKTKNKKGLYLQIYESFYDPERGHTAHKSFKPIGYVHELQAKGIDDPVVALHIIYDFMLHIIYNHFRDYPECHITLFKSNYAN